MSASVASHVVWGLGYINADRLQNRSNCWNESTGICIHHEYESSGYGLLQLPTNIEHMSQFTIRWLTSEIKTENRALADAVSFHFNIPMSRFRSNRRRLSGVDSLAIQHHHRSFAGL